MCTLFTAILVNFLTPSTAAAQFSFETTGSFVSSETTFTELDLYNGSISWFIAPVDESKGPLAEAAFLSRSSSIRYGYTRFENSFDFLTVAPGPGLLPIPIDSAPGPVGQPAFGSTASGLIAPNTNVPNLNTHSLDTRYVVHDTSWIVSGSLSLTDGDFSAANVASDQDDWSGGLSVGRYVLTNTTVSLRAEYDESEVTAEVALALNFPSIGINQLAETTLITETETVDISLVGEHVGTVGDYSYRLTANAGYFTSDIDLESVTLITDVATGEPVTTTGDIGASASLANLDGWRTGLSATWYFNNRIGLNANYQFAEFENQQTNSYGVGLGWFITRYLEVRGNYGRSGVDGAGNDVEQWGVALRGRF